MISGNRPASIIDAVQRFSRAARGSVINESLIYLSYHNRDMGCAFQLSTLLLRYYRNAWLDRFEIDPHEDWDARTREARAQATGVIAVVSDDYLDSPYCRAELAQFQERDLPVIAVMPRDFSPEKIDEFTFSDWIDCRRWFADPKDPGVENLLSRVPQSEAVARTGERLDHLRAVIRDIELAFAKMPTSWASMRQGDAQAAPANRPRMIQPKMLRDWDFCSEKEGVTAPVKNLLDWSRSAPQFVLRGESGSGKTYFARLLALKQAHAALRDESEALPVWLDLAQWDARCPTLDSFLESQWPLLTYWRPWLDERQTLIILDNFSDFARSQPVHVAALIEWIEANDSQRFIVLARSDAEALSDLPALRLSATGLTRAQNFASGWLSLDQQSSFRPIAKQKADLIENSQLDALSLGVELMSADRALAFRQWHADPLPALISLRGQQTVAASHDLDDAQLLAGLRQLAAAVMRADDYRRLPRESATRQSIDPRVIDRALDLGFLEESGGALRFQTAACQWHLAAHLLKTDGLTRHLKAPEFAAGRGRLPNRWDYPARVLVDGAATEDRPRLIDQIAEIDPFLAAMCLRRHPDLTSALLESLIAKLVAVCARKPEAQRDFHASIADLPEANGAAELLIGKLGERDNARQLWLWREIRSLPLALPAKLVQLATDLDRASPALASADLTSIGFALSLAGLAKLSAHQDATLRRNAIWLLGEIRYLPTANLLMSLLEDGHSDDHDEVVRALLNFAHSALLARVLRWSLEDRQHRPVVIAALEERKRLVTSRLLALADARRLRLAPDFYDFAANTDEGDIAIGLAQLAAEALDLPESLRSAIESTSEAREWRDRLAASIKHLPNKEGFEALVADISAVLRDPPRPTISAGSNIEALLYGEPLFDDGSAPAPSAASPPDPLPELRSDDWERRHDALGRLAGAPATVALPPLLEATADEDSRVRLAACETLARFQDEEAAQKAVFAALADADNAVVQAATELLRAMPSLDCDALLDLLDSENLGAVAAAIHLLGSRRHQPAAAELRQMLLDERMPPTGAASIGQLARLALDLIEQNPPPSETQNTSPEPTAKADGFSDEEKVIRALRVLRDDDWGRTQKAAKFLRRFARHLRGSDNPEILRLLRDALTDDNWSVRWACAEALAMLRNPAAITAISARLDDPSWIVQVAAIRALVELGATGLTEALTGKLLSPRKALREATAEAMGKMGEARALPALEDRLKRDADEFVRLAALRAIDQLRPAEARAHLDLALSDASVHLRWFALQRLAPRMNESDLPILEQLLGDHDRPAGESQSISEIAIIALRRLDTAESRALLATAELA